MKVIKDLWLKWNKDVLKKMDLQDLKKELDVAQRKMFELRMKLELNELKQTHLLKFLRRYIAFLETLITAKKF